MKKTFIYLSVFNIWQRGDSCLSSTYFIKEGKQRSSAGWNICLCVTQQFEAFPSARRHRSDSRVPRVQSAPTWRFDLDSPVDDSQLILMNLIVSHMQTSVIFLICICIACFKDQNRQLAVKQASVWLKNLLLTSEETGLGSAQRYIRTVFVFVCRTL